MRRQKGFFLIELLIVVAAASTTRTLNTAQATYESTYSQVGYAVAIANLSGTAPCTPTSATACLVDELLTAGARGGYNYASNGVTVAGSTTNTDFATSANPQNIRTSGNKDFCSTSDMVIHFVVPGTATVYAPVPCRALNALQN